MIKFGNFEFIFEMKEPGFGRRSEELEN